MRSLAEMCEQEYGGYSWGSLPEYRSVQSCRRCGAPNLPAAPEPPPPQCVAPGCPAPAFVGAEAKPGQHVRYPDGRAYHFACHLRMVRALLADPPALPPVVREVARAAQPGV